MQKKISKFEGSAQSYEELDQEFRARGCPRSGNDANLSLERWRTLLLRKKKYIHIYC